MAQSRFELFSTSIARIWKSFQKLKTEAMTPFGLRSSHVMCIFFLQQAEGGLTASEISELSELDKGAVSRAVSQLEKLGYVQYPKPEEKRRYRAKIVLSEEGYIISEKMNLIIADSVEKAGRGMSAQELETFEKSLAVIATNLAALAQE